MRNKVSMFILTVFVLFSIKGFAGGGGGGCTPTTSGSCATAVPLTVGAACVNGTTCGGGASDPASSCIGAGFECEWYSFTATATAMFVQLTNVSTSGCYNRSEVFNDGGGAGCGGLASISCVSGAPLDDMHSLTGLTIGNTYYIQNCYPPGGQCFNGGFFEVCTQVGIPDPPCNTCAAPCGTATGYPTTPTTATVVADCQTTPFVPELQPGSTNTFCYDFIATNAIVDFNVIITSNCGVGNVTNFSWSLYDSPSCGAAIQTGTLASLTFVGLTVGNAYVYCYTFDVPAGCTHSQHCPFFVGATILPITLTSFTGEVDDNNLVQLKWITEAEINNDYFTIERSIDAQVFEVVGIVDAEGNSTLVNSYHIEDRMPYKGISYYRLKETDYEGTSKYSNLVAVNLESDFGDLSLFPNPVEGSAYLSFRSNIFDVTEVIIYDIAGKKVITKSFEVIKGNNRLELPSSDLPQGMYFLSIGNDKETSNIKFIKE